MRVRMKAPENMGKLCAIVLAAGKGTRMGKGAPKVVREILDKPLIYWTLKLLEDVKVNEIYVVTGHQASIVAKTISELGFKVNFVEQKRRLGTAHSLQVALNAIPKTCKQILVLYGDDASLYTKETLKNFINFHKKNRNRASVITLTSSQALEIGGLERNANNELVRILTKSSIEKRKIKAVDVLCGAFLFERDWIENYLPMVEKNLLSGEYSLPKIIEISAERKDYIKAYKLNNPDEWNSVNSKVELMQAEEKKRRLLR